MLSLSKNVQLLDARDTGALGQWLFVIAVASVTP